VTSPNPTSQNPSVQGGKSDLDQFVPLYDLRDSGGPRTAYEERGDRGYGLPEDLGLEPNWSDRFFSPLKQGLMQFIVWVSGISMRLVGAAFFSDLFSNTIGPVAYKLMAAQQETLFKPLVILGGVIFCGLYGWHFLQKEDSETANRLLVTAAAALAFAVIVFAAPAAYFGSAIDGTTALSGSLVGSVGQISKDLTIQDDKLVGSDQSVALRRITNSIHETSTTEVWCHSVMKSQAIIDKYCEPLRASLTISASEQETIDALPADQRADARSQLVEKKQQSFDDLKAKICNEDPGSCERLKGFDSATVFILLLLSALVIVAMMVVIGLLALVVVVARFMYFLSVSVGPDVVPMVLLGDYGQRLFKMWLWLGIVLQLFLQIVVSLILSLTLVFTYGVFAIQGMPWGLKLLLVGLLFVIVFKRRNTIFAKLMGGNENARANIGMHIFNKASGAGADYASSHRPEWSRRRGSNNNLEDMDSDDEYERSRDEDESEQSDRRSGFGRLRRRPDTSSAFRSNDGDEDDSGNGVTDDESDRLAEHRPSGRSEEEVQADTRRASATPLLAHNRKLRSDQTGQGGGSTSSTIDTLERDAPADSSMRTTDEHPLEGEDRNFDDPENDDEPIRLRR